MRATFIMAEFNRRPAGWTNSEPQFADAVQFGRATETAQSRLLPSQSEFALTCRENRKLIAAGNLNVFKICQRDRQPQSDTSGDDNRKDRKACHQPVSNNDHRVSNSSQTPSWSCCLSPFESFPTFYFHEAHPPTRPAPGSPCLPRDLP